MGEERSRCFLPNIALFKFKLMRISAATSYEAMTSNKVTSMFGYVEPSPMYASAAWTLGE